MCLIIDANVAAVVFSQTTPDDFKPVLDWLHRKDGCLVYGGRLADELTLLNEVRRYLLALQRAGRARLVPEEVVEAEEEAVRSTGEPTSNDVHVLALARASGARTLCSHDRALHTDFKNPRLITHPRGHVYQTARHVRLLRHTSSCGRGSSRGRRRSGST